MANWQDDDFVLDNAEEPSQPGCYDKYGKRIMRVLFSHVGLCFLLAFYCALGAIMFIVSVHGYG